MAEISWPDSYDMESTVDMLKDKVNEHHNILRGNGKEGVVDFISGLKGQIRLLIVLVSCMTAFSGIALVVVTMRH
jgi:hypothetical protein